MATSEKDMQYETISMEEWESLKDTTIPVAMNTRGISMWPLLRARGDHIRMVHPQRKLMIGDIVTFRRADGQEITHRLCWFDEENLQTLGDNCDHKDAVVPMSSLLGLVTHVSHKGHLIHVDTKFWRAYGRFMMWSMPFRMFIRNRLYRPVKHMGGNILRWLKLRK